MDSGSWRQGQGAHGGVTVGMREVWVAVVKLP